MKTILNGSEFHTMLRYYCIAVVILSFWILSYIIFPIEWLIGKFSKRAKDISCFRIVQFGFKMVLKASGVSVTVIGEENVPEGAVLFVCNHRSAFDIPLTYVRCKNITGYVAKKAFAKVLPLSGWMRQTYCVFLDRSSPRAGLKTILDAIERIKSGISIFIFPEGRRNCEKETELLPFKNGAFKIATKSGCPIVPVAINNSASMFERQEPRVTKEHVVIEYGKPIYPDKLDNDTKRYIGAHVRDIMTKMLVKNSGLV